MNRTEALLVGIILGMAIPTNLIHEWSLLMRQRVGSWVKRRRLWLMLIGILVGVALICSAFILGGVALARAHDAADVANRNAVCLRAYVSDVAPLSLARDAAQQQLWDDFKAAQTVDQTDKAAVKEFRMTFFADLDKEREANRALQDYRREHKPAGVCQ